jgi:hypothetical protein
MTEQTDTRAERLWLEGPFFDYGPENNAWAWREAVRYLEHLAGLADELGNATGNEALQLAMGDVCMRAREEARRAEIARDRWREETGG